MNNEQTIIKLNPQGNVQSVETVDSVIDYEDFLSAEGEFSNARGRRSEGRQQRKLEKIAAKRAVTAAKTAARVEKQEGKKAVGVSKVLARAEKKNVKQETRQDRRGRRSEGRQQRKADKKLHRVEAREKRRMVRTSSKVDRRGLRDKQKEDRERRRLELEDERERRRLELEAMQAEQEAQQNPEYDAENQDSRYQEPEQEEAQEETQDEMPEDSGYDQGEEMSEEESTDESESAEGSFYYADDSSDAEGEDSYAEGDESYADNYDSADDFDSADADNIPLELKKLGVAIVCIQSYIENANKKLLELDHKRRNPPKLMDHKYNKEMSYYSRAKANIENKLAHKKARLSQLMQELSRYDKSLASKAIEYGRMELSNATLKGSNADGDTLVNRNLPSSFSTNKIVVEPSSSADGSNADGTDEMSNMDGKDKANITGLVIGVAAGALLVYVIYKYKLLK